MIYIIVLDNMFISMYETPDVFCTNKFRRKCDSFATIEEPDRHSHHFDIAVSYKTCLRYPRDKF